MIRSRYERTTKTAVTSTSTLTLTLIPILTTTVMSMTTHTIMDMITTIIMVMAKPILIPTHTNLLPRVRWLTRLKHREPWKFVVLFWRTMSGWRSATGVFSTPADYWS